MPAAPRCDRFILLAPSIICCILWNGIGRSYVVYLSPNDNVYEFWQYRNLFSEITNNLGTGETLHAFSYFFNFGNSNVSAVARILCRFFR